MSEIVPVACHRAPIRAVAKGNPNCRYHDDSGLPRIATQVRTKLPHVCKSSHGTPSPTPWILRCSDAAANLRIFLGIKTGLQALAHVNRRSFHNVRRFLRSLFYSMADCLSTVLDAFPRT